MKKKANLIEKSISLASEKQRTTAATVNAKALDMGKTMQRDSGTWMQRRSVWSHHGCVKTANKPLQRGARRSENTSQLCTSTRSSV